MRRRPGRFGGNIVEVVKKEESERQIKRRKDEGQKTCAREREKKSRGGVTFPTSRERKREAEGGGARRSAVGICFKEQSRM